MGPEVIETIHRDSQNLDLWYGNETRQHGMEPRLETMWRSTQHGMEPRLEVWKLDYVDPGP